MECMLTTIPNLAPESELYDDGLVMTKFARTVTVIEFTIDPQFANH